MARSETAVTMLDVARASGVSEITVSRVLRNSGPISTNARERVLDAVRATGYVHNRLASAMASARSNLVGVILPSLSSNVFPDVIAGIDGALSKSGFQPVVGVSEYDPETEEAIVRSMLAWKPAALILTGLDHTRATQRMLMDASIRVVEIMDIGGRPIDVAIGLDHKEAGCAIGQHLVMRGYRRFGYVGHDLSRDLRALERKRGLTAFLRRQGLAEPVEHLVSGPSSITGGRAGLAALLAQQPDVDVVVFSNDDMAVGGVFHCIGAGITPKDDLGIFGFNGLEIGQALPRPLSTVHSDRQRIGQIAVEAFIDEPERPDASRTVDTGFSIIPGETA